MEMNRIPKRALNTKKQRVRLAKEMAIRSWKNQSRRLWPRLADNKPNKFFAIGSHFPPTLLLSCAANRLVQQNAPTSASHCPAKETFYGRCQPALAVSASERVDSLEVSVPSAPRISRSNSAVCNKNTERLSLADHSLSSVGKLKVASVISARTMLLGAGP